VYKGTLDDLGFIGSTPVTVCHTKRIGQQCVFSGWAAKVKPLKTGFMSLNFI